MVNGTYTIGIDCRLSGSTHAGIGRYIENLITRLPFDNPTYRWVLFFYTETQVPKQESFQKALKTGVVKVVFAPVKHYSLKEQIYLPKIFLQENLDLLHVPHFNVPLLLPNTLPLVITIHDLLWHEHRGTTVTTLSPWKYWIKYLGYRLITRLAIYKAKAILVPSTTVKQTVQHHYPTVAPKITVTYEGADDLEKTKYLKHGELSNTSDGSSIGHSSIKIESTKLNKTLLYVGSLYPHKNISLVLKALQKLPDYQLAIAGSRSVFRDAVTAEATQLGVSNQVVMLGFVPDNQLQKYYQSSLALVQPSLSEGFGLTGLEAMASGGVVLASDIPVFKEIYGDGASYFDPHSVESFISIVKALTPELRDQLRTQGLAVSATYSWTKMVKQTTAIYHQIVTGTQP
jgi:glycosyltransferase involved in cell wall biosynthesis